MEKIFLLRATDRAHAISRLLVQFDLQSYAGKRVALKANYNSADGFPASTHPDTLGAIVKGLKNMGAADITLAERSGMGDTREVLSEMGVSKLSQQLGFRTVVLDELNADGWMDFKPAYNIHWRHEFLVAKIFRNANKVVQTCCLKTHRFGGHFTLSLKNSVGLIAKDDPRDGYNYMTELHSSPYQREMIAEVNLAYKTDMIITDGIEAFVKGGPEDGERVSPEVILAGRDRVAMDAVGVAILRLLGTTKEVSQGLIFEQQQISRAADLGLGVHSAKEIELVPLDAQSREFSQEIAKTLAKG